MLSQASASGPPHHWYWHTWRGGVSYWVRQGERCSQLVRQQHGPFGEVAALLVSDATWYERRPKVLNAIE